MGIQQKIDRCLEDSNYPEALNLYEQHKKQLRPSSDWLLRIVKVYYSLNDYDKVRAILQQNRFDSPFSVRYEAKLLEFKTNYLLDSKKTKRLLQELEQITSREPFQTCHRDTIQEFKDILEFKQTPRNKMQLKAEGTQYERLVKKEGDCCAESLEAFPMYIVSQRWMNQWKKYVYLILDGMQRNFPGPINQFDILDHPFYYLHDPLKKKSYTNRYLLNPADYVLITKECWNFLERRYSGIPIVRYNICNFDKNGENFTEVSLKCLKVKRYNRGQENYQLQISRRDTWKRVEEKIVRSWENGRLWKHYNNKFFRVNLSGILEEEETSGYDLVFELPVKGKWLLPEPDPEVPEKCANCSKAINLKFCQCRKVKYCSNSCQNKDRPRHQRICVSNQMEFQMSSLIERYDLNETINYSGNKGLVGLKNIGNSCYMNTGIQCLSNTKQLTQYFLSNDFIKDLNSSNPLGSNGQLACAYAKLVRDLWTVKNSEISPWDFKKAIAKFSPQFSGYGQHDSQEFIATLLDGLHEDTNLIKKKPVVVEEDNDNKSDDIASRLNQENYLKRNKSYVSGLMVGQFKSTIRCPTSKCNRVAVNFDAFMTVSLPILQPVEVALYFVPKELVAHVEKVVLGLTVRQTVGDIVSRLVKIFQTSESTIMMMEISVDFEVVRQIDYKQTAMALINTKQKDSYVFCYELSKPILDNKRLYTVGFTNDTDGKPESFPRLMILNKSIDYEKVQEVIWKCLSEYVKTNYIRKPKQLFKLSITDDKINVALKQDIKLRTYKESKKHAAQNSGGEELNLEDCLNNFSKDEKLDQNNEWYCNRCKQHVQANKKMDIYKANKIIVFALKRFKSHMNKIKTFVSFPITVNLGPYIINNTSKEPKEYELYAVVNHFGTVASGHYTAYCKNYLNHRWYEFNDSRVTDLKESEVVSKNAYVLFYRRKS